MPSISFLSRSVCGTSSILGLSVISAAAATFTVTTDAESGPGSFQQAVVEAAAVPAGETGVIVFDADFFAVPRRVVLSAALPVVKRSLVIEGPAVGEDGEPRVTLSGDRNGNGVADAGDGPGLNLEVPTGGLVTLKRLAFAQCWSTATPGGAVFFRPDGPASLLIEQCVFEGNVGRWGGAVSLEGIGNQGVLRDCRFSGNRAAELEGGALHLGPTPAVVEGWDFPPHNAPAGGGAVHTFHGQAELRGCFFDGNTALPLGAGGAISARVGLRVAGSSFINNRARAGGALFLNQMRAPDPGAVVENSTFSANSAAAAAGGAIYAVGTDALLRHCTITLNRANEGGAGDRFVSGGGIAVPGAANVNRLRLHNCVVAGNLLSGPGPATGTDLQGPAVSYQSLGGNVVGIGGVLVSVWDQPGDRVGTLEQPLEAVLGSLADNGGGLVTHLPMSGSPAIDTGVPGPEPVIGVDQRGVVRPSGVAADAGSVEVEAEEEEEEEEGEEEVGG